MKDGYNDDFFEIKCKKCGSTNCSIIDHNLCDEEDNIIGESWHIECNDCHTCDI